MLFNKPIEVHKTRSWQKKIALFDVVNTLFLVLVSIVILYPFYQCLIVAFSDGADITMNGIVYLWPRKWSLESFRYMLGSNDFLIAVRNSVARTLLGSFMAVLVTSCYAFALSHTKLKLRKFYTTIGLITMYFSGGMIPTFLLIRSIGLYDSFWVYLLPMAFNMFNAMVFLAYFRSVPLALEECAMIDGANEFIFFFRIMIPVSIPVFSCVLLFEAVAQWNAYFDCLIYTTSDHLTVLAHRFAKMLLAAQYIEQRVAEVATAGASSEELMAMRGPVSALTTQMASMVITVLPIMCVYPFLQKYFVQGIMVGSLKG
jgi:putative aldouronate transport system permease protein